MGRGLGVRVGEVITAIHGLLYSSDPPVTRAFLRDVLGWPYVEHGGSGAGWLIFRTGPSEIGVHPASWGEGETRYEGPIHHEIALMCDDIATTRADLEAKGARFRTEITDQGFGLTTLLEVPGADAILVYQPTPPTAYDLR